MQENPLLLFHWEDADLFTFSAEMSGANFPSIYEKREWGFLKAWRSTSILQAESAVVTDTYFIFHGEMLPYT